MIFLVRLVGAQVVVNQPDLLPFPLCISQLIAPHPLSLLRRGTAAGCWGGGEVDPVGGRDHEGPGGG